MHMLLGVLLVAGGASGGVYKAGCVVFVFIIQFLTLEAIKLVLLRQGKGSAATRF